MIRKLRKSLNEKKSHSQKIGTDGVRFLKEKKEKEEGELIQIKVKGYKNDFYLRSKSSDIPTFYQCIFDEEYDIDFRFEPKIIVDLGANIGLTTVFFKSKYPDARIIAVEPEQSNYEMLLKNTSDLSDVQTVKGGAWNKKTFLEIEDKGHGHYGYMVKEVEEPSASSIQAWSIESLMNEFDLQHIDVLKIDIEGSEKELFENNTEFWLPKVKVLIVETHDRMKSGSSKSVFSALVNYNFQFEMKGENIIFYLDESNQ